jgi:hypothetical protein
LVTCPGIGVAVTRGDELRTDTDAVSNMHGPETAAGALLGTERGMLDAGA